MSLSRRDLISSFAALGAAAMAPSAMADDAFWQLGFENAPAEGIPEAPMRLVHGRAPAGLEGVLYRNGPGWFRYGASSVGHWFDGDGFVQRFAIADGNVRYSGRFVDTAKRRLEMARQEIALPGFGTRGAPDAGVTSPDDINAANTSVLMAGDEVWALWEGGSPFRLDPDTLDTRGVHTFRADLAAMPFLAHPKVEPNGRIWNLGVNRARAIVWRLAADGALEAAETIDLGQPSYVHDWAVSERHLIIPLQPWLHERFVAPLVDGYVWRGDQPFRVLVLDKDDLSRRRIYELPAMFFFHTGDAWEDGAGTIHFDLCASPTPTVADTTARDVVRGGDFAAPLPELVLASLHPDGSATLTRSGSIGEFPQTDRRRQGHARELTAIVSERNAGGFGDGALALIDWRREAVDSFSFEPRQLVQEHLFAPKPHGAEERDAWLIGLTLNTRARATELHVFDAARVSDGPVATWRSDYAAPLGFHGVWHG